MTQTKVEQKANRYANEQTNCAKDMLSNAYMAGYCKALNDIQAVMGKTATNDVSVLMDKILTFIEEQKSNS